MNIEIDALAGQDDQLPLKHRILNVTLIFGVAICLIGTVIDLILSLGTILSITTFFAAIIFGLLYYLSAVKRRYGVAMYCGLIILIFVFIPFLWTYNGGITGGFPYYLILISSIIAILLSGYARVFFLLCLTAVISVLIVLEYRYPFLIKGYRSSSVMLVDMSVALILTIISNALLFAAVVRDYNKENMGFTDYLTRLETANEELQREMEERQDAEDKYRAIFETTGTAVVIIEPDLTISLANEEFEKLSGFKKAEIEGRISWRQFFSSESITRLINCDNGEVAGAYLRDYETHFFDHQGSEKDVIVSVSFIPGTQERVASFVDITNIKQVEAQLKYLATHDYLTGIPNRYSFEESLNKVLTKARQGRESAILFLDIDNFKLINDANGHAAGDEFLINMVGTIKENLRTGDILARLGGDEFGVLLEDTDVAKARQLAERLRQVTETNEFCTAKYGCFNSSLSIGVVMIDGSLNSQRLLSLADTALYAAKEKGRNRVVLLEPDLETSAKLTEINQVYGLIRNAIAEDRFLLYFQPVVRVDDGEISHYEALIRLKQFDGRLVMPQTFIHVAERFGLMPQIDRWVVRKSLEVLRQNPNLSLFINISGTSLSEESLLGDIEELIVQCDMESCRIGFEVTETAAVKDIVLAKRWTERLNRLGCRFALDDFGIGFSSFSYLRMLPVDYLKIDGSFIRNIDTNPANRALVEAMNAIAHSLNKKSVAEYVENAAILRTLRELKVDYAQGYYLGMPSPTIEESLNRTAPNI